MLRMRPSYTTGTGQCRQRCAQPCDASTAAGGALLAADLELGVAVEGREQVAGRHQVDGRATPPARRRRRTAGVEAEGRASAVDPAGELAGEAGRGVHRHRDRHPSAQPASAGSQSSTERSSTRTSWPRAREAASAALPTRRAAGRARRWRRAGFAPFTARATISTRQRRVRGAERCSTAAGRVAAAKRNPR